MKRVAIITGASSGMGRVFARTAAEHVKFDELWIIARRADRLEEIKAELTLSAPIMGKTWTPFSPTEAYKQVSMQELVTAIKNMKN